MELKLLYVQARTARAQVEDGILCVRMPRHWPQADKEAALGRFQRWASRRQLELSALPPLIDRPPLSELDLWRLVGRINAETLRVNVTGVRLGTARRTRLAQANHRTGVLTFSRYAVDGLPDRSLRYLILHELAHLRVPDHSIRFWDLVARFEPDWRRQRKLAQTHFERAVSSGRQPGRPQASPLRAAAELPFEAVIGMAPGSPLTVGLPAEAQRGADRSVVGAPTGGHSTHESGQQHPGDDKGRVGCAAIPSSRGIQMPLFPGIVPEYEVR